ncbi:uncharacterized protein LOC103572175 isoform X1 [Microplitis demolitor]|uniref:uncharacterized protein LOC103572175 isoform X1 n=1 Tax=Microplitis demolitor TaxID=69319 RepID=UPI0004CD83A3|nr:uncharacterized protein LOC103572175 isoform X1 [Microplitis demolitor]
MALEIFLGHVENYFEQFDDYNNVSPYLQDIKNQWDEVMNLVFANNTDLDVLRNYIEPWSHQILVKIYPLTKRNHNISSYSVETIKKIFFSFLNWQLLTKPLDLYSIKMEIQQKYVDQGLIPVEVVCTAAMDDYFAICTKRIMYFYRNENIKRAIYKVKLDYEISDILTIHFYQTEISDLIAIVRLNNYDLKFYDVKYRKEILKDNRLIAHNLCVGTHHHFFLEYDSTITDCRVLLINNQFDICEGAKITLFRKKRDNEVLHMFSESNKLLVVCQENVANFIVRELEIPTFQNDDFQLTSTEIDISDLQGTRNSVSQILIPVNQIIMSAVETGLIFGRWAKDTEGLEVQTISHERGNITSYAMHADILFLGFSNGYIQIYRIDSSNNKPPSLTEDESTAIRLSADSQPITSISLNEFKGNLYIIASTILQFYVIKFSY